MFSPNGVPPCSWPRCSVSSASSAVSSTFLGELAEQATRAGQAHALFSRLREQPLDEAFLTDAPAEVREALAAVRAADTAPGLPQ